MAQNVIFTQVAQHCFFWRLQILKLSNRSMIFCLACLKLRNRRRKILMILILKQSLRQAECQQENLKVKSLKPMKP
ncbi:hypothetical protein B6J05_01395 [Klebsiella quasipneumoniae]|nr:hypothetical protein B6J05_01395 [Klebsiella quasipneumoniae]